MSSPNRPLVGIALMILSGAFLAAKDGLAKTFLDQVSPLQMIWTQYVGSFVVLALVALPRFGVDVVRPVPLLPQIGRGAFSSFAVVTLYWALTYIPLADATAMFMLAPLIVALGAPFVLREKLDATRLVAAITGFLGVVVILRPGFGGVGVGYYIALLSGVLLGGYLLANRLLARSQAPLLNIAHNSLTGGVILTLLAPLYWQTPPPEAIPKLLGIVVLAVAGQGLMISSFMYAPAAVIAPFTYAMLVFAVLIGYLLFGTFPDLATWIGIVMIVGAGVFIAERERRAIGR